MSDQPPKSAGSSPQSPADGHTGHVQLLDVCCPICGTNYRIESGGNYREGKLCVGCGASGRSSAIVHTIRKLVFEDFKPMSEQPKAKNVRIIGMSDGPAYAKLFAKKFDYTNTFFHRDPFLDVTNPPEKMHQSADILISTEVFEHVLGPVERPFLGAYKLLKPGGTFVLTVPFTQKGEHQEHYPGAIDYNVIDAGEGKWHVEIVYSDEETAIFTDPKFHGGPGKTLEVRLFNRAELVKQLENAGFVDIDVHDENEPEHGICWGPPSRVVTAKRALN